MNKTIKRCNFQPEREATGKMNVLCMYFIPLTSRLVLSDMARLTGGNVLRLYSQTLLCFTSTTSESFIQSYTRLFSNRPDVFLFVICLTFLRSCFPVYMVEGGCFPVYLMHLWSLFFLSIRSVELLLASTQT